MIGRISLVVLCGIAASCGRIDYDPLASQDAGPGDTDRDDGGASTDADIGSAAWSEDAYIKSSDPDAFDWFAGSVALSSDGNTLAVGAIFEDGGSTGVGGDASDNSASSNGAVFVFVRANGSWQQQAYIKANNAGGDDLFGTITLSADGNTLAVGASKEDSASVGVNGNGNDNSQSSAGAAYIFTRSDNRWTQEAYLKASNTDSDDEFGAALSLSGDGRTLAVAATGESSSANGINGDQNNNDATGAGAVYLFARSESGWSQQAYVKASQSDVADAFGSAVSLSHDGSTLAVGASSEDGVATGVNGDETSLGEESAGAVYVFSKSANSWSQAAYIKASNPDALDFFGNNLSLSGDGRTLAVDAPLESSSATGVGGDGANNEAIASGAVYVFSRQGSAWSQEAYVKASNAEAGDRFGNALALSYNGATLAVGTIREDSQSIGINGDQVDNSADEAGAVYVFQRADSQWSQASYVKAFNTDSNDILGDSLGLSGNGATLVVGAPGEASMNGGIDGDSADNSGTGAGAVYVYER